MGNTQINFDWDKCVGAAPCGRPDTGQTQGSAPTGDLSPDEISVLRLIQPGRANAISKDSIAAATGIHWRTVQEIIEHLIHVHDCNIGSSSGRPFGYYLITDPEEIEEVYNSLRRRGIKILCRAAKLKKISVEEVFGQGRMGL